MDYRLLSFNEFHLNRSGFHVLTYAEEGFAPLTQHTKEFGVTKDQLVAFQNLVNTRDETGTLYPIAPVSAIPRRLIRDDRDSKTLCKFIEDFYQINSSKIHAKKLLLDFTTSRVEGFVLRAVEMSLVNESVLFLDELFVIK